MIRHNYTNGIFGLVAGWGWTGIFVAVAHAGVNARAWGIGENYCARVHTLLYVTEVHAPGSSTRCCYTES